MSGTTIATLRAVAGQRLEIETAYGTYRGRLTAPTVDDAAVMLLFATDGGDPDEPLVIAVDDVRAVRPIA